VQGGRYEDLRIESATELGNMDFDGYGIGGTFSKADIIGILKKVNEILPAEKPRHLLGISEPEDMFIGVEAGIDTFDCVVPTRNGRNGTVYTEDGKFSIEKAQFATDLSPIDPSCSCRVCTTYTRSYVHHLFRSKEMLGMVLASMHNMHFLADLTARIRASIVDGTFMQFRDSFLGRYKAKKGASA
jgi:queuine tRNA-ribosyltransferase